jgi:hypothetical protein
MPGRPGIPTVLVMDTSTTAATSAATAGPGRGIGRNAGVWFAKALGGLALLAVTAASFALPLLVMASDNCFEGDPRFICTVTGQLVVGYTPMIIAPTALVLGLVGLVGRGGRLLLYPLALALVAALWGFEFAAAGV